MNGAAARRAALLRLLAGAVLISFSPVWVTLAQAEPTASAFYRLAIGGAILLLWVAARGESLRIARPVLGLMALAGACFALDLFFWHRSILAVGAGVSTLLGNFQVFILTLAAFVLYRQRPTRSQLVAMPLALAGLALLVGVDGRMLSPGYRLGVVFGLLTAVSYAAYILVLQAVRVRGDGSPIRDIAVSSLVGAVCLAGLAGLTGESLQPVDTRDAGLLLAYALGSTVFGWVLIASSLARLTAAHVGLVLLLQPVLSFCWDALFFARHVGPVEAAGAGVVLLAIWLGSRRAAGALDAPGASRLPGAARRWRRR